MIDDIGIRALARRLTEDPSVSRIRLASSFRSRKEREFLLRLPVVVFALTLGSCGRSVPRPGLESELRGLPSKRNETFLPPNSPFSLAKMSKERLFARVLARWRRGDRRDVVGDLRDLYTLSAHDERIGLALLETSRASGDRGAVEWLHDSLRVGGRNAGPIGQSLLRLVVEDERRGRSRLLSPSATTELLTQAGDEAFFAERFSTAEEFFTLALRASPEFTGAREGLEATRERQRTLRTATIAPEPPSLLETHPSGSPKVMSEGSVVPSGIMPSSSSSVLGGWRSSAKMPVLANETSIPATDLPSRNSIRP